MERAPIKLGDPLRYRSFAGPTFDAVVMAVRADATVDIDVDTGSTEPIRLTHIRILDCDESRLDRGQCALKGGGDAAATEEQA